MQTGVRKTDALLELQASEDGDLDSFKHGGPTWYLVVESNTKHQFWNSL